MALDLGHLGIEQIVFHELPEGAPPVLSEAIEDSGPEPRLFFRDRLVDSLASAGRAVRFHATPASKVPGLVTALLAGSTDLLTMSQACALELATFQAAKTISPGLLCVAKAEHKQTPALALVKLEMQEGVRLARQTVKGKRSFTMQSVKDLMMSESTRVFKAAVFYRSGKGVKGLVSEHQTTTTSIRIAAHGAAHFFLERFLSCTLEEFPEVTTARFYEAAVKFIASVDDKEKQYRYDTAIHAELMSHAADIDVTKFARRHIDIGDRATFTEAMKKAAIPSAAFTKDIARIAAHLQQRRIDWQDGLSLRGPASSFDEHVTIGDGGKSVTVKGPIKKVGRS